MFNDEDLDVLLRKIYNVSDTETEIDPADLNLLRLSLIAPGTNWCGPGSDASDYDDLGTEVETDKCCRQHDYCADIIPAGETKHNLTNESFFTRLHCSCDDVFRQCLRSANTSMANKIGTIYFNAIGTKCYKKDYPVTGCNTRGGTSGTQHQRRSTVIDLPASVLEISTSKIAIVEADDTQSTAELAAAFDVSIKTMLVYLDQIGKVKMIDKWEPHKLNDRQREVRVETCLALLNRHTNEGILNRIVTCAEQWILFNNPKRSESCAGVIHNDFLPNEMSITADVYYEELNTTVEKLARLQPALVNCSSPLRLQDNAQPHTAQQTVSTL
ncbi:unnamed protein product [Parnassius apollo]|uniref:Phospholipase A2 n=1 Tax=Parnassius apollo TaxID=110799 RepID=A0A8S3XZF5_PARAO|nr:unnamed protein product [Parnassius apollo]